jgi:hypothetical protein
MSGIRVTITEPKRRAEFEKIFGTATVQVKSARPTLAEVGDLGVHQVYMLDLDAVVGDALDRLVAHLAAKFGVEPYAIVEILRAEGMAILAEDCFVSIPARFF